MEIGIPQQSDRSERKVLYFGPFALDAARRQLFRRGTPIHLTNKALHLLSLLVSNPNATLTIDEIVSAVWSDNEETTDATLRQHILMLRRALEESTTERYIVTDHGRGYRFIGEVAERPPTYMTGIVEQYSAAAAEFRNSGSPAGMMAALHLYERALTIDDSSATALAGAALTRALMADSLPRNVSGLNIIATARGIVSLFSGEYAARKEQLHDVCSQWPEYWFARTFLGLALMLLGNEQEAVQHFDRVRVSVYHPLVDRQMNARYFAEGYALYARFRHGDVTEAETDLRRLEHLSVSQFVPATCFALAEIGRRNRTAALRYIRQCGDNRECWYTHLRVEPLVKELALAPAELYRQ